MPELIYKGKGFSIVKNSRHYTFCDICDEKIPAGRAYIKINANTYRHVSICLSCFNEMIKEFNSLKVREVRK